MAVFYCYNNITLPVEQSAPVYPGLQLHVPPVHAPFPLQGSGTHGSTVGTNNSDNVVRMTKRSKCVNLIGAEFSHI